MAADSKTISGSEPAEHQRKVGEDEVQSQLTALFKKQREAPRLSFAESAKTLVTGSQNGVLATRLATGTEEGFPICSSVEYAADAKGRPIFCFTTLSHHTQDLMKDGKCSLLVPENKSIAMHEGRVSLTGRVRGYKKEEAGELRDSYLAKMPEAFWVDFGDFRWFRMDDVFSARYVADVQRVARTGKVTPNEYQAASVDPVAQYTAMVCGHFNRERADFNTSILRKATGLEIEKAEFYRLDRLGLDVLCSYEGKTFNLRLPFPRPALTREQVEEVLEEMGRDAGATVSM